MKNLDWKKEKIRNYLTKGINQNELMSKKHKRVCKEFLLTTYLL